MDINLRDFFAGSAYVDWIYNSTPDYIESKTGVKKPDSINPTAAELAKFHIRAEIAWRFIFAGLMLDGFKPSIDRVDKIEKERKP